MSTSLLQILQTFLIVLGVLGVIWGIYDMFGEGQQSSVGIKKMIGGIAFAAIAYFVLNYAIKNVSDAETKAVIHRSVPLKSSRLVQAPKGRYFNKK